MYQRRTRRAPVHTTATGGNPMIRRTVAALAAATIAVLTFQVPAWGDHYEPTCDGPPGYAEACYDENGDVLVYGWMYLSYDGRLYRLSATRPGTMVNAQARWEGVRAAKIVTRGNYGVSNTRAVCRGAYALRQHELRSHDVVGMNRRAFVRTCAGAQYPQAPIQAPERFTPVPSEAH